MLYGNNPRLPIAAGKAVLKIEPAMNTRLHYSRRGERATVEGVIGAALVIEDPDDAIEIDENGRARLRVMSADELEALAWRLLRYAQALRLANAVGVDLRAVADAYFGSRGGAAQDAAAPDRRGRSGGGEDALEEAEVV